MIGTYYGVRFWCNLDPCGLLCVVSTWIMVIYAMYVVVFILLRPTPISECLTAPRVLTSLAFTVVAGLALTAHIRTMLTNPGAVPRYATPVPTTSRSLDSMENGEAEDVGDDKETSRLTGQEDSTSNDAENPVAVGEGGSTNGQREGGSHANGVSTAGRPVPPQKPVKWCHKCDAFKPPRAHHCSLCQRCVVKMDHHCPWVNNCVGIGNQKLFLLFCAYTCLLCVFALSIMGFKVLVLGDTGHEGPCRLTSSDRVATVGLAAMSIMFGLFTLCMACDQCQVASTNQTKIDRMKGEVHESSTGAHEIFGGEKGTKCKCHWLLPIPARFPPGEMGARIFGYYCRSKEAITEIASVDQVSSRRSRGLRRGSSILPERYEVVPSMDIDEDPTTEAEKGARPSVVASVNGDVPVGIPVSGRVPVGTPVYGRVSTETPVSGRVPTETPVSSHVPTGTPVYDRVPMGIPVSGVVR